MSADRKHELAEDGALNMVIVGGGPTGVETAGVWPSCPDGFRNDYPDMAPEKGADRLVEASP